jgi:hypothetical protein
MRSDAEIGPDDVDGVREMLLVLRVSGSFLDPAQANAGAHAVQNESLNGFANRTASNYLRLFVPVKTGLVTR